MHFDLSGKINGPLDFIGVIDGGGFWGERVTFCDFECEMQNDVEVFSSDKFYGTFTNGWSGNGYFISSWVQHDDTQLWVQLAVSTPDCPTVLLFASGLACGAISLRRRVHVWPRQTRTAAHELQ